MMGLKFKRLKQLGVGLLSSAIFFTVFVHPLTHFPQGSVSARLQIAAFKKQIPRFARNDLKTAPESDCEYCQILHRSSYPVASTPVIANFVSSTLPEIVAASFESSLIRKVSSRGPPQV